MIEQRYHRDFLTGDETGYYHDTVSKRDYSSIQGGLAWPIPGKAGFLVAVGETIQRNPSTKLTDYWIVDEAEHQSHVDLIDGAHAMMRGSCVERWYGDVTDSGMVNLMHSICVGLDNSLISGRSLYPIPAPNAGNSGSSHFYMGIIESNIVSEKKRLHFGKSMLPIYLNSLNIKSDIGDYPALMALGYVMSAYRIYDSIHVNINHSPYNPLDPEAGY